MINSLRKIYLSLTINEAWVDQLITNPLDFTQKLVYADWEEEHGNMLLAQIMRVCAHEYRPFQVGREILTIFDGELFLSDISSLPQLAEHRLFGHCIGVKYPTRRFFSTTEGDTFQYNKARKWFIAHQDIDVGGLQLNTDFRNHVLSPKKQYKRGELLFFVENV